MSTFDLWVATRNVGAPPLDGPPFIGTGGELDQFIANAQVVPGGRLKTVGWYQDFTETFSTHKASYVLNRGMIPSLTLEPWNHADPGHTNQPLYRTALIAGGAYDVFLTALATDIKNWAIANTGHIYLRFAHEQNGNWYPWSDSANGNAPGDYVLMWQHVWNLFNGLGVTPYVTWQWCVNVDTPHFFTPLAGLYPGNAFVNEIGMDGYCFGVNVIEGWLNPTQIFEQTRLDLEALAPTKPVRILETGCVELAAFSPFLFDTFTGDLLNTGMWNGSSYGVVSQSGGHGIIPTTSAYSVIGTVHPPGYDLTNHFFSAQMFPPSAGAGQREVFLQGFLDANNLFQWVWTLSGADFHPMVKIGGIDTLGPSITYDPIAMSYWKIANVGGNLEFSTSSDGAGWTVQWTTPVPFAINSLEIYMVSGFTGVDVDGQAEVDNFNSDMPREVVTGTKPVWINQLCSYMDDHPDILSFLWFEFDNNLDALEIDPSAGGTQPNFLIETSPESIAAFASCFSDCTVCQPVKPAGARTIQASLKNKIVASGGGIKIFQYNSPATYCSDGAGNCLPRTPAQYIEIL